MRNKILGLFAAAALLAACETGPDSGSSAKGSAKGMMVKPGSQEDLVVKPGSQEDLVVSVGDRVFFDFDKFNIKSSDRKVLEKQAAWLKTYPKVFITIQGHADERGTREYNLALGERRANSVKDYLISLGVNPGRVNTISYGKERPVATGSSESAWSQNRRGVTKVNRAGS